MAVSSDLIEGYDNLAASLGATPVLDENGEIIPIGNPEGGRVIVYVVWVGRAVGLFYNWGLASAMITGFPGESHKGFRTLEKARLAWYQGPTAGQGAWRPPRPRVALRTSQRASGPGNRAGRRDGGVRDRVPVEPDAAVPVPIPPHVELPPPMLTADVVSDGAPLTAVTDREAVGGDFDFAELMSHDNDGEHDSDSDDEFYWGEDDVIEDSPARDTESVLSTTVSSISSLSLSLTASPALTDGTISPGPIATPSLPPLAISPDTTPRITTRTLSCPGPETGLREPPPIRIGSARDRAVERTPSRPYAGSSHPAPSSASRSITSTPLTTSSAPKTPTSKVARSKGAVPVVPVVKPKEFFVVVRGDHPGIYMDRHTALLMLGSRPGIKLVMFKSLSRAAWYFVQQYMARKVGVPVLVRESEPLEDDEQ